MDGDESDTLGEMIPSKNGPAGVLALALARQRALGGAPAPTMSQAQFSGYPGANPALGQQRQAQLAALLRARAGGGMPQPTP